jgi:hypothetical protein
MRNHQASTFGDFKCGNCGALVSSMNMLSGVQNRNHCPYCLWSRHLDLYSAGDRLSACKAGMKPIGLTMKKSRNKYQLSPRGELMLVHTCSDCESISINRIAADDDLEMILAVFQSSLSLNPGILEDQQGIVILNTQDEEIIHAQLYGLKMKSF